MNEKQPHETYSSKMDQNHSLNSTAEEQPSDKRKTSCCNGFKMFFLALSFTYIAKTLSGVVMKNSITQIERRFDISSSLAGLIDGSFEIGNLLVIVFVSYFGSKLHRPKLIGIGCIIMGIGSLLTALPHFFMGYYRYSKDYNVNLPLNSTSSLPICSSNQNLLFNRSSPETVANGCVKESGSNMWIYVLMGNMLRGIGETPIAPLGVSYIDDFAKEGHSSFYIGSLHAVGMLGPIAGFLMTSLIARLYVDIGFVDLSSIRITPKDSRWVGAWWLGFLVAGTISLISSIPFFFLPKSLNIQEKGRKDSIYSQTPKTKQERKLSAKLINHEQNITENVTGLFQSLKNMLTNPRYVTYLSMSLLYFSSFVGVLTYIFKYIEQQYGQSLADTNFWIGSITVPTVSFGLFIGGYIIRKFKLSLWGIAKLAFSCYLLSFLCQLIHVFLVCETKSVAGITLTYNGKNSVTSHINVSLSYCNMDCNCDKSQWEPVCGENGITYVSPCLAGCTSSDSNPKSKVFYNCRCVDIVGFQNRSNSVRLGECPRNDHCKNKFYMYLALQAMSSLVGSMGGTPGFMLIFKNVEPELKSLAVGFHSLTLRSLGGILAPIYFGALIDRACLKWSIDNCGKQGTCRLYDSKLYGYNFFSLSLSLKGGALVIFSIFLYFTKKKHQGKDTKSENGKRVNEENLEPLNSNGNFVSSASGDGETHI